MSAVNPDIPRLVAALQAEFDRLDDGEAMRRRLLSVVEALLPEDPDLRQQTEAAIDQIFTASAPVATLRQFCRQVVALTVEKRPPAGVPSILSAAPEPLAQKRFERFQDLLVAALVHRVHLVTGFFHRRHPKLERETLPPFLLSPEFDRRLAGVIAEQIVPLMMKVPRFVAQCELGRNWKGVGVAEFWAIMAETPALEDRLLSTWRGVWNGLKPVRTKDGKLQVPPGLASLREALAPGEPPAYSLPRIGDDVINLLVRLLSDLRDELERHWQALEQLCGQEVLRRPEVAAEAIAERFQSLPGRLGEFVAILCHYTMTDVTIAFLETVADSSLGTLFLPTFLGRRGKR